VGPWQKVGPSYILIIHFFQVSSTCNGPISQLDIIHVGPVAVPAMPHDQRKTSCGGHVYRTAEFGSTPIS
jgi:hypothetical protein